MKTLVCTFASSKYWTDKDELNEVFSIIQSKFQDKTFVTFVDNVPSTQVNYKEFDDVTIVVMSGSTQPDILECASHFEKIVLFAGYVPGNFPINITDLMLCKNAGPTLMDTYGTLKREPNKVVSMQKNFKSYEAFMKVLNAYDYVKNSKVTVIKGPEPWVISTCRDTKDYEKTLGLNINVTSQEELLNIYKETTDDEAKYIYDYYLLDPVEIIEPTNETIMSCARMAKAMIKLIEKHNSCGLAIACFDLIKQSGINPCIGVSYINSETEYFAACEGDVDSAITMLLMHGLTNEKPFMANPCLQEDDSINFAHCTAPVKLHGKRQSYILRNHHETGVGTSIRVLYPENMNVTLLRYSGVNNVLTINKGITVKGRYEPNCRTQICIKLNDFDKYIDTVQGCHQVISFDDIEKEITDLCKLLRIKVI
ncbi:MAG: hypothetical protein MJ236_06275 [Clostridia bacterium]|nr:hypothetical protein [Clostridia bacterium]